MKHSGGSGALSSLPFTAGSSERETIKDKVDKDVILLQKVYGELVIFIIMHITNEEMCDVSLSCFLQIIPSISCSSENM